MEMIPLNVDRLFPNPEEVQGLKRTEKTAPAKREKKEINREKKKREERKEEQIPPPDPFGQAGDKIDVSG